ncbi:MAG: PTS ascorbate transporter subunit IIC [Defluviitaleaceae bacterium]|nr:PTS ascorbate transporter subunit IIC [Defluviitaleaceae bacterium]
MVVVDFIINQILREAPIFLGLIALFGLLLQRKGFSDIVSGTMKTIVGVVILGIGVDILIGSILPLIGAFSVINDIPEAEAMVTMGADGLIATYGANIGLSMLFAFIINLIVARFTPLKNIFLTGHMLFWFPFIFVAVAVESGLTGMAITIFATIFTSIYIIVFPALIKPFVRKVTGNDSFTLGHPTIGLSLIAGWVGKLVGNKEKSTEDIKFPKQMEFLREITITSSLVVFVVFLVVSFMVGIGSAGEVFGTETNFVMYSLLQGLTFGAGLTVLLLGVRMMLAEIIPAFKGIADKLIPNAVPALDCPIIFPFAPNAVLIGFIVSMITSTATIILFGAFSLVPFILLPLTITCFFEIGTASVIANGTGGLRGSIIGSAVAGVVMVVFVAISIPFLSTTVADWILIFGGNDFSLWAVISGLIGNIFGGG